MAGTRTPLRRLWIGLPLVCSLLAAGVDPAGADGIWLSQGPDGGVVTAIALDPTAPGTIYVGTQGGGAFQSTDAGQNWTTISSGLAGGVVTALAVDPVQTFRLHAATLHGMYSSLGNGHWLAGSLPVSGRVAFHAVAVDPREPWTIYAGSAGFGVLRSTDFGSSWKLTGAIGDSTVTSLAIDPLTPGTLYAGTQGQGVFRTADAGATWMAVNVGLGDHHVRSLAIDPVDPAVLYAGTDSGLYRSADAGGLWTAAGPTLAGRPVLALAIDRETPAVLYAAVPEHTAANGPGAGGVFRSTDGGATFSDIGAGLSIRDARAVAVAAQSPGTVYAGGAAGLFRRVEADATWAAVHTRLRAVTIRALVVDPETPSRLYATSSSGVLSSTDAGATWSTLWAVPTVNALAVDAQVPSTLYVSRESEGVFRSTNGGTHWTAVNAGLTTLTVTSLAVDPQATGTVYAGTSGGGVFRTTNAGASWTAVNTGLTHLSVTALAVHPETPAVLYAGTADGGVFRSLNAGASWTAVNAGLWSGVGPLPGIEALAIATADPSVLYLAATDGAGGPVFRSTDGGDTWVSRWSGLSPTRIVSLAIDPASPSVVYAGSDSRAVLQSTDGGASWRTIDYSFGHTGVGFARVTALSVAPSDPPALYAGTEGRSIYRWYPNLTPRPVISSVTPSAIVRGATTAAVIEGMHLTGAVAVLVSGTGVTATVAEGGSDTVLPVTFAVAVDASGAPRQVTVVTANGVSSSLGSVSIVLPPPLPVISRVTPVFGLPDTVFAATISGSRLDGATAVTFSDSRVTAVIEPDGSFFMLPIRIAVAADALPGPVAVTVTTPAGTSAPFNGFFVQDPQSNQWVQQGPDGGTVLSLAVHPTVPGIVYAGTAHGGVFRSADGGTVWTRLSGASMLRDVRTLAIDPRAPAVVYAGGDGGLIRSTDGGVSWEHLPAAFGSAQQIVFHPIDAGTLHVAASFGVYRSDDRGATWTPLTMQLPIHTWFMNAVAVDPVTPSTLYAATGGMVIRSLDAGVTWTFSELRRLPVTHVRAIAIDPQVPTTLYAATAHGVFRSLDRGESWALPPEAPLSLAFHAIAARPGAPATIYAGGPGVWRTHDGGEHWLPRGGDGRIRALAIDPHTPGAVYAGTAGSGILRLTDGSATWSSLNTGLAQTRVLSLAGAPGTAASLYAGTIDSGVYASTDAAASWTGGLLQGLPINAVAVHPQTPSTAYVGTTGIGVLRTTNAGASWTTLNDGLTSLTVFSLAIHPQIPTTLYAGTGHGVFRSLDAGATWTRVTSDVNFVNVRGLAIDPETPSTVYAAARGVLRSTDGGTTWTIVSSGPSSSGVAGLLVIDPSAPSTLYVIATEGVYRSTNSGATWTPAGAGLPDGAATALAADPHLPGTLYASTAGQGVFRSTDRGTSWAPLGTGLAAPAALPPPVLAVAVDPGIPSVIYAGTDGWGTWRFAPPPALTGIEVPQILPGTARDMALTGSHFFAGGIAIDAGPGIHVASIRVLSHTTLVATFTVDEEAAAGDRNVRVATAHGVSDAVRLTVLEPLRSLELRLAQPPVVGAGFDEAYELTVRNVSTDPTSSPITVTTTLPEGLSFVAAEGSGWSCAAPDRQLTCTRHEPLEAGESSLVRWVVAVDSAAGGVLRYDVEVAAPVGLITAYMRTSVTAPVAPTPVPSLVVLPSPLGPGQQATASLTLASPFPHAVTGRLSFTFTSTAVVPGDDPAVQFESGGREVVFTIDANSLEARFGDRAEAGPIAFQTGTVAGSLVFTAVVQAGTNQTTVTEQGGALTIPRRAPQIHALQTRTEEGSFAAHVLLSSTARDVTHVTLQFDTERPVRLDCGPVPACSVSGRTMTIEVASLFGDWFTGQSLYGGLALMRLPLAIDGSVQGRVIVRLGNGHGFSSPVSFQLP